MTVHTRGYNKGAVSEDREAKSKYITWGKDDKVDKYILREWAEDQL